MNRKNAGLSSAGLVLLFLLLFYLMGCVSPEPVIKKVIVKIPYPVLQAPPKIDPPMLSQWPSEPFGDADGALLKAYYLDVAQTSVEREKVLREWVESVLSALEEMRVKAAEQPPPPGG